MHAATLQALRDARGVIPDGNARPEMISARLLAEMVVTQDIERRALVGIEASTLLLSAELSDALLVKANLAIGLGGTSQALALANAGRRGMEILNTSAGDLWVQITDVAAGVGAGFRLSAGQSWTSPPQLDCTQKMNIWGATTGQTFYLHTY